MDEGTVAASPHTRLPVTLFLLIGAWESQWESGTRVGMGVGVGDEHREKEAVRCSM